MTNYVGLVYCQQVMFTWFQPKNALSCLWKLSFIFLLKKITISFFFFGGTLNHILIFIAESCNAALFFLTYFHFYLIWGNSFNFIIQRLYGVLYFYSQEFHFQEHFGYFIMLKMTLIRVL